MNNIGRIIAFDIGNKRIGIAISDPFNIMAMPLETYHRKAFQADLLYLAKLVAEKEAKTIICGLPLNTDGTKSEQTLLTESFAAELGKHTNVPIIFQDERYTTLEARRVLIDANVSRDKRKNFIDKIAATYILEDYMRKIK